MASKMIAFLVAPCKNAHCRMIALGMLGGVCLGGTVSAADVVVTNLNDAGAGSLRQAIGTAAAGDRIVFNVPGSGTIVLNSNLPPISGGLSFFNQSAVAVTIDLNGNGPLTFTGGVVDLGNIVVTGAAALAPEIRLGAATRMIGDANLVTADVATSGIVAPGANASAGTIGELTLQGDLDARNSRLQFDINNGAPLAQDRVIVDGVVDVTDATLEANFVGANYVAGDTFTVLSSTSPLVGTLANATEIFELPFNPFLEAFIVTPGSSLRLDVRDNGLDFVSITEGCNQLVAAAELDRLRGPAGSMNQQAAIATLRNGSGARVNEAINQISGIIYPSIVDAEIQQVQMHIHAIRDRVVLQRDAMIEVGSWTPWVRAFGTSFDIEDDACLTTGYRHESAGIELGAGRMDASGLGVHLFTHFGSSDTWIPGAAHNADTDAYRFGGSLQYLGERVYGVVSSGWGHRDHAVTRSLDALALGTEARMQFDGSDHFGYGEVGTAAARGNVLWLSFVSLQGIRSEIDGGEEGGNSDFGLNVQDIEDDSLRSMVGVSYAQTGFTSIGAATTQVRLGWLHEFEGSVRRADTSLIDAATPANLAIQSVDSGSDWLSIGGQLDWAILFGGQLSLAYQGNLNSETTYQSGFVGTRWLW